MVQVTEEKMAHQQCYVCTCKCYVFDKTYNDNQSDAILVLIVTLYV